MSLIKLKKFFFDIFCIKVGEHVVFADTTGSSANPYCMVYVRAQGMLNIVNIEYTGKFIEFFSTIAYLF